MPGPDLARFEPRSPGKADLTMLARVAFKEPTDMAADVGIPHRRSLCCRLPEHCSERNTRSRATGAPWTTPFVRRHAASPAFGNQQRGLTPREHEAIPHAVARQHNVVDDVGEFPREDDRLDVVGLAQHSALPPCIDATPPFHPV